MDTAADTVPDLEAFAACQAERIPRTAQVQRVGRNWGQVWHDDGPEVS